jgi:hypothetical protein
MFLKYFLSGLIVKLLAGFDDTMTRIPIMSNMTKSHKGRIAFASGIFIAITIVTIFAFVFASLIKSIPYVKYISAGLIFILAMSIQFDLFTEKPKKKIRKQIYHVERVSNKRFLKLIFFGFITAFVTILDDMIAYSGVFLSAIPHTIPVMIGIFIGTIIQLIIIIYFSSKFVKIKYKKEITVFGLILLSLLIALGVL